jgi:hypothetical protein
MVIASLEIVLASDEPAMLRDPLFGISSGLELAEVT